MTSLNFAPVFIGDPPNAGSGEALKAGCTCPVLDNRHGEGVPTSTGPAFIWSSTCPLHGLHRIADSGSPSPAAAAGTEAPQ